MTDTNPLREALQATLCELTACAAQLAARGLPGHPDDSVSRAQKLARAALASEPVAGTVEPVLWVIPGDDNARENGSIDAMAWQEGEFSKPLYAAPPAPAGREAILEALRSYFRTLGGSPVQMSHGVERVYYSGFSLGDLADALSSLPPQTRGVSPASYCALCDLEHQLHEDAQGFHHVVKGERAACCATPPAPGAADRAAVIEECALICAKHAAWAESRITEDNDPSSSASQLFAATSNAADDCAAMIRDLKSAPVCKASQNSAEGDPAVTPDWPGADAALPRADGGAK